MQFKRLLLAALAGLTTLSVTAPVYAIAMSAPNGWYLEGNAGSAHLSNTNYSGSTSSSGIGGNANLGYKFMPYVGVEVGYSQYPNSEVKDSVGTKAAIIKHYSYDIAARAILPVSDSGFEGFAKLGVGRMQSSTNIEDETAANNIGFESGSHSSTGVYMGVGASVYFTPELAGVVQWQRAQGSSSSGTEDLYSIGISFLFV